MISVVIPAFNEEKLIAKCLDSLVKQETSQEFEIIFVDNNSTDTTKTLVEAYKDKLNLHIFTEKRKGRGAARRLGFSKATGAIILSTDADAVLPVDWIERLTHPFKDSSIVAATGTCHISDCSSLTNFIFNTLYQPSTELFYRFTQGHWCLIGPNFAIRKEIYDKTEGFDASLNCREDADISAKIAILGKMERIKLSVTFSGRRYKKGLLSGVIPYPANRLKELVIGRRNIVLQDIR
ncbi:MAG TPA: glycosyltransferase family 2 protein [Candidatus Saccharimonadales bacterium]|nr:glycosyltransferase family 2 protein [Candidatus Saccharimonadales bacterium]